MNSNDVAVDPSEYDYIVVGAGSAGCALAGQLSKRPDLRVLVIEAGPADTNPLIHMPKAFPYMASDPRYSWKFPTEPEPHRNFSADMWPRGKVLGGSSSINGMVYARGHPADYDSWAAAGNPGWEWTEVLRCFKELEDHSLGASETRGSGGPLHVTIGKSHSDISTRVVEAGVQMGIPHLEDLNTPGQEAIGYSASTTLRGRRFSAARAHLYPAKGRPNLRIVTDTEVERVIIEDGRAVGVKARGPAGDIVYRARREVILSGGAILSPKLLMLSGIGDPDQLRSMGIEVRVANPHVGAHMLDHVGVAIPYRLKGLKGNNHKLRGLGLAHSLMRYFLFHDGVLSTAGEVGAFIRAHPDATRPDAQLMIVPVSTNPPAPGQFMGTVEREPGFIAMGCVLNATSEGTVSLSGADPFAKPRIQPNAMTTRYDQEVIVAIVKFIRRMVAQPALADVVGDARAPWPKAQTDDEILALALRRATNYIHAVGTCRMGVKGEGVVDEKLRVRGVDGLRVADCSVMPTLPAGNTNGPAQMVGWRAAELILEGSNYVAALGETVAAA
jgi:choline dehydrogenase-like flavoprotein